MKPSSRIDQLPEPQRKAVIDALLAGQPLREVAKMVGISHVAVGDYKRKVILPTIQAAQKFNALRAMSESPQEQVRETMVLTRDALHAGPLLDRIQKHQATLDASIVDAREDKDSRGVASLIGTDLKGLELSARLTGLLDSSQGPTVTNNLFMLMPTSSTEPLPTLDADFTDLTDTPTGGGSGRR